MSQYDVMIVRMANYRIEADNRDVALAKIRELEDKTDGRAILDKYHVDTYDAWRIEPEPDQIACPSCGQVGSPEEFGPGVTDCPTCVAHRNYTQPSV